MYIPSLIVLAGGFGTRLKSILPDLPKPMAPIGTEPFLYFFIKNWERQGIHDFTFLLHYNSEIIKSYILKNHKSKFSINSKFDFITEKEPLGTGGAICNAILEKKMRNSFLLSNCDTWIGDCVSKFLEVPFPSIGIVKVKKNNRYGTVNINKNIVTEFQEKKISNNNGFINAGIYYLNPLDFYNYNNSFMSLEKDFLPNFCKEKKMNAIYLKTNFIDIGIPSDYLRFVNWIKNDRREEL